MKVLSIDTSSSSGSIALIEDRRLISEWTVGDAGTHSNWLLGSIKSHLESARCPVAAIDIFAADIGPGSFTGLRIGISTLKGLAWSTGRKVAGVSTLASLAMNIPYSRKMVCPVLDARKGEVYAALYDTVSGLPRAVLPDSVMSPDDLVKTVSEMNLGDDIIFLGSGLTAYLDIFSDALGGAKVASQPLWQIKAANVGLLAFDRLDEAVEPAALSPIYLRKSEAELKRPS
ncbi:MAG TPA: tRNA (adenosine(37)-N6)-threonylcarbamoyltransferase complex dimerization subunit type 1 TsaB [Deltaproteobacteria bacterium]|nr:MAG: tRNA (adenosine(37)-N6)-threonylcarbamoyltransferase complex dimerization subunit type 1 TsaB [Deltaproteobacteria bacterium GWA2_55_82]OGQ63280.1 MAG: tRNA (adenosine(37)-N6)-threonylcarbamoyltransferase complex dimerization subunit type 1 TsaB [Deltaproteobacteria bacterium RIFCSPLOWO2_02_FULL_55_12]OIJ73115.1 MAG: tRNA (adenosine(37)-N6)-threonylcarbamoyltransferase complex dimerization subunit type 1 TsaB [Deltaproteobacteria bacterium GWC2_55_46]HBG47881.1 tRNA (adenosine(37)-N6)-th